MADGGLDFFSSMQGKADGSVEKPEIKGGNPPAAAGDGAKPDTQPEQVAESLPEDDGSFLPFDGVAVQAEGAKGAEGSGAETNRQGAEAAPAMDEAVEARAVQLLREKLSGMPEDVKRLVEFATSGGDSVEYMRKIVSEKDSPISEDMDMSSRKNQAMIVAYNLALDGYDQEYIQAQLDFLSQQNKLEAIARKQYAKWLGERENEKRAVLEKQRRSEEEQRAQRRKMKADLSNFLNLNGTVGGMQIDGKDREELPDYMMVRSVRMDGGNLITQMQRDLYAVLADRDKSIVLAKLLRNSMNLANVRQQAETDVVKRIKRDMRRTDGLDNIRSSAGGSVDVQSIADLF